MKEEKTLFPCLHVAEGDLPKRVLTCGDPARAEYISTLLEQPKCLAKNREYWTYSGYWKGVELAVSSHGVGCGGAAITFESMWRAGAKVIIRVGTCGGMQKGIDAGSIIIATGACREDGVTEKMLPLSYPAICDGDVVRALTASANEKKISYHKGIVLTQALFYPSFLESKVRLFAKAGVIAMENEVASLLVVSGTHGVKAGAILTADAPAFELIDVKDYQPDQAAVKQAQEDTIRVALDAVIRIPLD